MITRLQPLLLTRLVATAVNAGDVARKCLLRHQSAWTYRHPPRTGTAKHYVLENLPAAIKDIAWKAQTRLCGRYRALAGRGKLLTVAVTAVARELAGFVWAIGREVKPMPTA